LTGDETARQRELREAHRLFTEIGAPIRAAEVAKDLGFRGRLVRCVKTAAVQAEKKVSDLDARDRERLRQKEKVFTRACMAQCV
jgi:hypothetical protein